MTATTPGQGGILLNTFSFYSSYFGHNINHLISLIRAFKALNPQKPFVFLAGDSSLDNKHWLKHAGKAQKGKSPALTDCLRAVNGYDKILDPPVMLPDVSYHLNTLLPDYYTINTAVEEATIASKLHLSEHDMFIKNNITYNDVLIVSIGGNDIALTPTLATIANMLLLVRLNDLDTIKKGPEEAWGMDYFIKMFKDNVEAYILKLIGDMRPKKIIVCMIYYPDLLSTQGWADTSLSALGYDSHPEKLQEAIKQIFNYATSKIKIPGSKVIPFPMFKVMNGRDTNDYVERAEPSIQGGRKLATEFAHII